MVSRPLHNFKMPSLRWGSRKVMRCVKVDDVSATAKGQRRLVGGRVSFKFSPGQKLRFGGEIEAAREEFVLNIPAAAAAEQQQCTGNENETRKPWNLRKRRARLEPEGCEDVKSISNSNLKVRGGVGCSSMELKMKFPGGGEKSERPKFSVSLSKEEIEMDFMEITGRRLSRRPKKRSKIVQRKLDVSVSNICVRVF